LQVFFKSPDFFPFILQQQLTTLDLVGYCGGSLGLFLGFSLLSAVEFVYYFTLRLICLRTQRKKVAGVEIADETQKKKNYLIEFAENSSIHGFNQIVFEKRHPVERFVF
jgi:hypothetical protein